MKFDDLLEPNWPLDARQQERLCRLIVRLRAQLSNALDALPECHNRMDTAPYTFSIDCSALWHWYLTPPGFRTELRRRRARLNLIIAEHKQPRWWWGKKRRWAEFCAYKAAIQQWMEETKRWLDSIELDGALQHN